MEHCEICFDTQQKEKFHQVGLEELYKTYLDKDKYPAFYKHALSMVSLFENTYRMRHKPRIDTGLSKVRMGEY